MRSMLACLVILAEMSGLAGIGLITTWMVKYLGGFAWDGGSQEFNVHPLMMVVGMLFFNGNALMLYRVTTILSISRTVVKFCHAALHLLATLCGIIGIVAVFQFHNYAGIANMYSFHSWVGLTTFLMFGLQFVLGFMFFIVISFTCNARSEELRAQILPLHRFLGKIILILATVTTCMGIQEKCQFAMPDYSTKPTQAVVAHLGGFSFLIFTTIVLYVLGNDSFKNVTTRPGEFQRLYNADH